MTLHSASTILLWSTVSNTKNSSLKARFFSWPSLASFSSLWLLHNNFYPAAKPGNAKGCVKFCQNLTFKWKPKQHFWNFYPTCTFEKSLLSEHLWKYEISVKWNYERKNIWHQLWRSFRFWQLSLHFCWLKKYWPHQWNIKKEEWKGAWIGAI